MRYINSQNAWCLLNTPGFTTYAGSYDGTSLRSTLDGVMRLQARARESLMSPTSRFFLSRESNEWLNSLDGSLLSTICTSSTIDLGTSELFSNLIAPHISAADFTALSAVLSSQGSYDWTFMNLSSVSSMYEPLV